MNAYVWSRSAAIVRPDGRRSAALWISLDYFVLLPVGVVGIQVLRSLLNREWRCLVAHCPSECLTRVSAWTIPVCVLVCLTVSLLLFRCDWSEEAVAGHSRGLILVHKVVILLNWRRHFLKPLWLQPIWILLPWRCCECSESGLARRSILLLKLSFRWSLRLVTAVALGWYRQLMASQSRV